MAMTRAVSCVNCRSSLPPSTGACRKCSELARSVLGASSVVAEHGRQPDHRELVRDRIVEQSVSHWDVPCFVTFAPRRC